MPTRTAATARSTPRKTWTSRRRGWHVTTLPLFPASVVGSLPRPPDVLRADRRSRLGRADGARWTRRSRYAVAMQEMAGLDVVTDGEWWRRSYIGVIAELAHGFALETNPPTAGRGPWSPTSSRRSPPGFIAAEAKFLKKRSSRRHKDHPARPGAARRAAVGRRCARATPIRTREDFVRDCVAPLRREIELIAAIGVDIVQIDDPHLCLFVDPDVRRAYDDPDRAADFAVDMTNALVAGFTRRQARRAPVPPRRRARAGREAPRRRLRADPAAAQPAEGAAPDDGVHRRRAPATSKASAGCARISRSASAGRRDAGRGANGGGDRRARASAPCSASTPSASRSIPTAASPPARPPRSTSTRSISSCAPRPKPRACSARAASEGLISSPPRRRGTTITAFPSCRSRRRRPSSRRSPSRAAADRAGSPASASTACRTSSLRPGAAWRGTASCRPA